MKEILLGEYCKRPQAQISDMLKLIYQNEFGCGHMVTDEADSLAMIVDELQTLREEDLTGDAFEDIGNGLCSLYLRALRNTPLAPETLNRFFCTTANEIKGSAENYERKVGEFVELCEDGLLPFDVSEITRTIDEQRSAGYPAFRHSEQYRAAYAPSYRVVKKEFCVPQ